MCVTICILSNKQIHLPRTNKGDSLVLIIVQKEVHRSLFSSHFFFLDWQVSLFCHCMCMCIRVLRFEVKETQGATCFELTERAVISHLTMWKSVRSNIVLCVRSIHAYFDIYRFVVGQNDRSVSQFVAVSPSKRPHDIFYISYQICDQAMYLIFFVGTFLFQRETKALAPNHCSWIDRNCFHYFY